MRAKLVMLSGLPGSGKSIYAEKLLQDYNTVIHSSDELRKELFKNINHQSNNDELFKELHKRIKDDLRKGKTVVYDATNINYKRRKAFLDELNGIDCYKICRLIATPYETCLKRNAARERSIPEDVIKRMYLNFWIPQYYEGWDYIGIHRDLKDERAIIDIINCLCNGSLDIPQDNPHHTLTIEKHCLKCEELLNHWNPDLHVAALIHDIGKKFTKSFVNSKGETTEEAHFYGHHNVSAYDSLFYTLGVGDIHALIIANYIQHHMQPFFLKEEKSIVKFKRLVGEDFWNDLLVLHEADVAAK